MPDVYDYEANGDSNGRRHIPETTTDVDENWNLELSTRRLPSCKIAFRSDNVGCLSKYLVSHSINFICLFGLIKCVSHTVGPILTFYMWYDILTRKDVPFGGFIDIPPHLGGQFSPENFKRGVNRHLKPNWQNCHIIKKLLQIDFTKILQHDKEHQMLFACGPTSHVQDGGWPPFWQELDVSIVHAAAVVNMLK